MRAAAASLDAPARTQEIVLAYRALSAAGHLAAGLDDAAGAELRAGIAAALAEAVAVAASRDLGVLDLLAE